VYGREKLHLDLSKNFSTNNFFLLQKKRLSVYVDDTAGKNKLKSFKKDCMKQHAKILNTICKVAIK